MPNVGIGTNAPVAQFEVTGTSQFDGNVNLYDAYSTGFTMYSGSAGYGYFQIGGNTGGGTKLIFANGQSSWAWDTSLTRNSPGTLTLDNNAGGAASLIVLGSGYYGTSSPYSNSNRLQTNGGAIAAGSIGSGTGNAGQVRMYDLGASGNNFVAFRAPDQITADTIFTLPGTLGAVNSVLTTDASGSLSWAAAAGGTGDFMKNGSVSMTGQFRAISGSTLSPGITFGAGSNTGMYLLGTNTLGFSTAGQERARIDNGGNMTVGGTLTSYGRFSSVATNSGQVAGYFGNWGGNGNIALQGWGGSTFQWWITGSGSALQIGGQGVSEPSVGALNISSTGTVGIGTLTATDRFEVWSTSNAGYSASAISATNGQLISNVNSTTSNLGLTNLRFLASTGSNPGEASINAIQVGNSSPATDMTIQLRATAGSITEVMHMTSAGRVGINSTAPAAELDVVGNIQYTGVITDVSDARLKKNVVPLSLALPKLRKVRTVSYVLKNDPEEQTEFGVIAQELQPIFPDLVRSISTSNDYLGVNYVGLIPWTIKALQELDVENQRLKAENEALKDRVSALEKKQEEQQRMINSIMERLDKDKK